MSTVDVDGIQFSFPDGWVVAKPDDWAFYRHQFIRMQQGIKMVDIVAVDPDGTVWLVEVKDYRRHARTKPSKLDEEVAGKILGILAMLVPAGMNASASSERGFARMALKAERLRIAVHLEQPAKPTRLRPRVVDPASLLMKLKKSVKAVDPHPRVVDRHHMHGLQWTVN